MSTSDLFDVLNIQQKPKTPTKTAQTQASQETQQHPRTTGLQRELYSLLGDSQPPILIQKEHGNIFGTNGNVNVFKERLSSINNRVTPWTYAEFKPTERSRIRLRHWVRAAGRKEKKKKSDNEENIDDNVNAGDTSEVEVEVSEFAKFDQKLSIPSFTEEEYTKFMEPKASNDGGDQSLSNVDDNTTQEREESKSDQKDGNNDSKPVVNNDTEVETPWTYEEVKYLFDLCRRYDLRWYIISDRYDFKDVTRSLEDLKSKFYEVSKRYFQSKNVADPILTSLDFPYKREVERKLYLERLLSRSAAEIAEEEALIIEAKKFEMVAKRILDERESMLDLLDSPNPTQSVAQYMTSSGITQLYNSLLSNKSKRRKYDGVIPENPWMKQQRQQEHAQMETSSKSGAPGTQSQTGPKSQTKSRSQLRNKASVPLETGTTTTKTTNTNTPSSSPLPSPPLTTTSTSTSSTKADTAPPSTNTTRLTKKQRLERQTALKRKTEAAYVEQLLQNFNAEERQALGVTAHGEKLTPGVFLRSSRISTFKPALQNRVETVLHELKLPVRPAMPSQRVVQQHEQLLRRILTLLDLKRQLDKLGAVSAIANPELP